MTDRQTILVADDDAAIRIVVAEALTQAGFAVETAADGSGLRKLVESGAGDAAIVDVLMPDGNGLELLPELREMRPELPVIVMSARNTLVTAVEASRAARAAAREGRDLLRRRFEEGLATPADLLQAEARATTMEVRAVDALAQYHVALARLRFLRSEPSAGRSR